MRCFTARNSENDCAAYLLNPRKPGQSGLVPTLIGCCSIAVLRSSVESTVLPYTPSLSEKQKFENVITLYLEIFG